MKCFSDVHAKVGLSKQDIKPFPFVSEVTATLVKRFGRPSLGNKRNPFNELLYIILSSKTPPERYPRAYRELRRAYPCAASLAYADPQDVVKVIQFAGLGDKKASQIVQTANQLKQLFGRVTLSPLRRMTNEAAEEILTSLPGIGIKSARCILLYSLDRQVFPADNHCLRIARRLGWVESATFTKGTANLLQSGVPPTLRRDLHVGMVLLGRKYCVPKDPRCGNCPILESCPTGLNVTGASKTPTR